MARIDRKDIPSLTGLRGVAACWVVVYHMQEFTPIYGRFGVFLKHGYLAVDIFFVLSGFVMAMSYHGFFGTAFSWRNYAVFMMRRLGRVYPLLLILTLAIFGLMLRHTELGFDWYGLLSRLAFNLTLTEAWGLSSPFDGPSWSVSTEMAAYLLFPLLALLTLYGRKRVAALTCVVAAGVIIALAAIPTPPEAVGLRQGPLDLYWAGTAWPLLRCITEFSLGLLTYRVVQHPVVSNIAGRNVTAMIVAAACLLALFCKGSDVIFVGLVPALILVMASGNNWVAGLFSTGPLLLLGQLSYAIYLLHQPLMLPLGRFEAAYLDPLIPAGFVVAASKLLFYAILLTVAAIVFHVIEDPARRLLRAIESRILPGLSPLASRLSAAETPL